MEKLYLTGVTILTWIGVSAWAYAGGHHHQDKEIMDRKIHLELADVPLSAVLVQLEDIAGVKFVYSSDMIDVTTKVSLKAKPRRLKDVLDELLHTRGIDYVLNETKALILLSRAVPRQQGAASPGTHAVIQVTGRVTDPSGNGLAGVNVLVKGTSLGTTTDADGRYTVAADLHDILVFSFIGFETRQIEVTGSGLIDVQLVENITSLNNIVVIGYGTTTRELNTGNVAKVAAEDLGKRPVTNPLQALQGMMPGVFITQQTGVPGGGFDVVIRGRNSLRQDANHPLYVIDGVPYSAIPLSNNEVTSAIIPNPSPLSNINPADIASIEILKDADATAIYGSRGANGVVLITTKKGGAGDMRVELSGYRGVGEVTRKMPLLSTRDYVAMRKEGFRNDGLDYEQAYAPDLLEWDTTRYTDWQRELIGHTAQITNLQLALSAGNEQTQFLIQSRYYNETTVFPGNLGDEKASVQVSVTHQDKAGKLKMNFSSNYLRDHNRLMPEDFTLAALSLSPNAPAVYGDDGALNWANSSWINPFSQLERKFESFSDNLISNLVLSYEVLPWMTLRSSLGYTATNIDELSTTPLSYYDPAFIDYVQSYTMFGKAEHQSWIAEPQLDIKRTFGSLQFSFLAGLTFQQDHRTKEALLASGFPGDALLENILAASAVRVNSATDVRYRYQAVFGRMGFNWKDRYLLNLTGRRDGSSRFGPANRFANFGAVGMAWIFSRENFLSRSGFLSFGKLRASYGSTGNDQIPDYGYLDTYTPTPYGYAGGAGVVPSRLVNPHYGWETNRKAEVSLELGFAEDKILVTSSWYRNRSTRQLVGLPLPVITGQSSVQANFPALVENRGVEFEASALAVNRENFKWSLSGNVTIPETILVSYPDLASSPYANRYKEGESVNLRNKFVVTGVDQQTGIYQFEDTDGNGSGTDYPTDLQFRKEVGFQYYGGLQSKWTYRQWELDVQFQYVRQTGNNYMGIYYSPPGTLGNQPNYVLDRWRESGDAARIQRFTSSNFATDAALAYLSAIIDGDLPIADASYIRLENVSLAYRFPATWLKALRMKQASVFFQGNNVLTFTRYEGMDPENPGVTALPPLRVLTLGGRFTF